MLNHVVPFILPSVIQGRCRSKSCRLSKCRGASLWSLEPQMTGEEEKKEFNNFPSSYLSTTDKSEAFGKGQTEKTPNDNLVEFKSYTKTNKNLILKG
jgi:hypothetical protein